LASGPLPSEARRPGVSGRTRAVKKPTTLIERVENSKKGIALVLCIVVVVILVSFYSVFQIHKDDALLSPEMYYRYVPATSTSAPTVHVWGDVYNWGDSEGTCRLTVIITDDEGHRLKDTFSVGPVHPHESVEVDKVYPWNYFYDSIEHPVAPIDVSVTT
jgi:hypothetical protein